MGKRTMERRRFQVQAIVVAIAAIDDDHRQGAQLIGSTGLRLKPETFNWITAFSLDCFHIYFVLCFGNTRRTRILSHQICYSFFLGGVTKNATFIYKSQNRKQNEWKTLATEFRAYHSSNIARLRLSSDNVIQLMEIHLVVVSCKLLSIKLGK